MCLAIPMRLTRRRESDGTAELRGVERQVSLTLCPDAAIGDYLLVHAGYAIGTLDADEAEKTLALFDEIQQAEDPT